MGRELTEEEIAEVESQVANMEVALNRAQEQMVEWVEAHVATPSLYSLSEGVTNGHIQTVGVQAAIAMSVASSESFQAFVDDIGTRMKQCVALGYLTGYAMGEVNHKLLTYGDLCEHDHSHDGPSEEHK